MLLDTGAQACGIDLDFFQSDPRFSDYICKKTPAACIAVNGLPVWTEGSILLPIKLGAATMHVQLRNNGWGRIDAEG